MDDLSLCLALELLDYMRRETEAMGHADRSAAPQARQDDSWQEMNEEEATRQLGSLQSMLGPASRMPEELREAIRWAEEEKTKRGMN